MNFRTGILLFLFLVLQNNSVVFAQQQSKELISKFYKDPDIEINTPGMNKTQGFMKYDEMMNYLEEMHVKRQDIFRIGFCGVSNGNKKIPVIYIGKENVRNSLRIWMQGGLHGNEPASTESVLMFISFLMQSDKLDRILDELSFAFIPMANIDGYEKQQRDNENNVDLNRDQVTLEEKESQFLKQAFTGFSPHVAVDFHEFRPFRKELEALSSQKLCISQDVLFLPSGNLNIPLPLRMLTSNLFLKNIKESLNVNNLTFGDYFIPATDEKGIHFLQMGGDSPRSSSTSYGLANAVSVLIEIRGIGLEHNSYKRRVYAGFLIARSAMETALTHKEKVLNTIHKAVTTTIKRKNQIVLNSVPEIYSGTMNFIDTEKCEIFPIQVQIRDTWKSKPVAVRERPSGYIVRPEYSAIISKLKTLGVKADTLKHDQNLPVEVFVENGTDSGNVESSHFGLSKQFRFIPSGSFLISTAQPNANFIISTLEPEMENGYYRYKMIRKNETGEIPVYRFHSSKKYYQRLIK